mmetsp:Transcript_30427/g.76191  ORF Transcript_30427/g.76191 Transcript_30427/m.76191 type:complete len:251 (+) Transcript_30427:6930-7682(+)
MPQRDTVAGEANCRSPTSKISLTWSTRRMRSPLGSVRSLLSSITEFIFSTHTASTSPSNTTYLHSSLSGGSGRLSSRKIFDSKPSVQSRVSGSSVPYSSATVCALGLTMCSLVCRPILVCERASVLMITDFPPPVLPTTMVVCLVIIVSYSWITLSTCSDEPVMTWYPFSAKSASTTSLSLGYLTRGHSRPGKRSLMRPMNRGTSSKTNLGRFMSRRARMSTSCSLRSGEPRLSSPAMTSTDLSARRPKS